MSADEGAFVEVPENCGVNFDETCDELEKVRKSGDDPDLGECAEGDEDCLARRRQSIASAGSGKSRQGSMNRSNTMIEGGTDADAQNRLSVSSKGVRSEPPFEGLPKNYYTKHYRPDYPGELQMKTICAKAHSVGIPKSHPKAVFIPSNPSLATFKKRVSGELEKPPPPKEQPKNFLNEPSLLAQNRVPPPIISGSDELVVGWLEDHNIQMMFEYFVGLSVIHQPENPWTFISDLCTKMIEARQDIGAFDDLPRILSPEHAEAIFRIYDRIGNGFMTPLQYKSALEAMGLTYFSMSPDGWEENEISKETFVKEATEAINILLRSFMVSNVEELPPPEEEEADYTNELPPPQEETDFTNEPPPPQEEADFTNEGEEEFYSVEESDVRKTIGKEPPWSKTASTTDVNSRTAFDNDFEEYEE